MISPSRTFHNLRASTSFDRRILKLKTCKMFGRAVVSFIAPISQTELFSNNWDTLQKREMHGCENFCLSQHNSLEEGTTDISPLSSISCQNQSSITINTCFEDTFSIIR